MARPVSFLYIYGEDTDRAICVHGGHRPRSQAQRTGARKAPFGAVLGAIGDTARDTKVSRAADTPSACLASHSTPVLRFLRFK